MPWTEEKLLTRLRMLNNDTYSWKNLEASKDALARVSRASVLVPLFLKDGEIYVWLTLRSQKVNSDKGDVSFPGGRRDAQDKDEVDTSLREAEEEIGLKADQVQVVALHVPRFNIRKILISVIVGVVNPAFIPEPNEEVEAAFAVPLKRFLSDDLHHTQEYTGPYSKGYLLHFFRDHVDGREFITWGITASVLMEVAVKVFQESTEFVFGNGDHLTPQNTFDIQELHLENFRKGIKQDKERHINIPSKV